MKKNMMTVIILALALMNLVLSALLLFSVVPATNKMNKLLGQVASVIDLELGKQLEADGEAPLSSKDVEEYLIDQKMTFNLQMSSDGKPHSGVLDSVTLWLNKNSKDLAKTKKTLDESPSFVTTIVNNVINSYSYDDANSKRDEMRAKVLEQLQAWFDSDVIANVAFTNLIFQ